MQLWDRIVSFVENQGPALLTRLVVALVIFVAILIAGKLIARTVARAVARRRAESMARLLSRVISVTVFIIALIMALDHLGVNVATILAGAGIIGLAVGFGAQNLVRDIISGFFILFDDVVREGDWVEIGGASGAVERVGLRMTLLRAFDGTLWYLPNGEVARVGNKSRDWMRAVVTVGLAYEQDASRGMQVMQEIGARWAEEHQELVLDPPLVQGLLGMDDSSVGVRLIVKVKPGEHWGAERELRARIKEAFDEKDVEIPFPRQVTYHRQEQGSRLAVHQG